MNYIAQLQMENQPTSNSNSGDYNLSVQHFPGNLYHLNIIDPDNQVHHFEGIYSSPQAAIEKGKSVIENFKFWREKTSRKFEM